MEANKQTIIKLVKDNNSHREIAKYLREAFPEVKRGFSERNVRLFCASNNIKKMKAQDVDQIVQTCVEEVSIQSEVTAYDSLFSELFTKYLCNLYSK